MVQMIGEIFLCWTMLSALHMMSSFEGYVVVITISEKVDQRAAMVIDEDVDMASVPDMPLCMKARDVLGCMLLVTLPCDRAHSSERRRSRHLLTKNFHNK